MSCPDCFLGSVHEGEPRGRTIKLHELDVYVTEPTDGRQHEDIIVIIPDAFGWNFVNNRILADHYADKGKYTVYLPDFMEGCSAPAYLIDSMRSLLSGSILTKPYHLGCTLYGIVPFLLTNRIGKSSPRVKAFFEKLRAAQGVDARIGAAGFCWGAKHVLLLSHGSAASINDRGADKTVPLINAGFVGHPSFFDITDVANTMTTPVSFALGELDYGLPAATVEDIRKAVEGLPESARGEVVVYDGCGHGFCVRADSTYNDVTKQALAAEDQCISWFNKHLKRQAS